MERTAIKFTNWTTEDFTFSWDSVAYAVKAGDSINLPDFLAEHAAKHLVDRELQKEGRASELYNDLARAPYVNKCFAEITKVQGDDIAAEVAALNQSTETVVEQEDGSLVDEAVSETVDEEPTPAVEEEFEGLNDETSN